MMAYGVIAAPAYHLSEHSGASVRCPLYSSKQMFQWRVCPSLRNFRGPGIARSASAINCASRRWTMIPTAIITITAIVTRKTATWRCECFELPTSPICGVTVAHRPDTRTDGIGKREIAPRHNVGACKKPSKGSQHWHELGHGNYFAAMSQKQILSEFDPTFGKPDILSVLQHEPIAELTSYRVADHATDDCSGGRNDDDRADVEIVLGPRSNRRSEKCGLARHRKANAFESDDSGNCD